LQPYLLEHALDSILERGEIPDVQLFTENICQTIAQSDYGRTLHLMNVMATSSVNVSELEWSDLLQQNLHRFSVDALKDLITHLSASETLKTDPAHGFVRALQTQCSTTLVKEKAFVTDCGDTEEPQVDKCSNNSLMEQDRLSFRESSGTHIFPDKKGSSELSDCSTDIPELVAKTDLGRDIVLCNLHSENKESEECNLGQWDTQVSAIDRVLDSMNSYGNSGSYEAMPAASEILESWEEEGLNDMFVLKKESRATMRG
jgi:predicted XRE-type DNA-binding protein